MPNGSSIAVGNIVPPEILTVRNLTVGYGDSPVLRDVEFSISAGTFLGLLGANGTGKSTLIRAITGQLPLAAGTVSICNSDLIRCPEKAKAGFGYAVEPSELPDILSGRQYLDLVASIRRCGTCEWPVEDLMELLALDRWLNQEIGSYSLGTRAKLSIAGALLGAPPLIILDETLNGLDPVISWRVKTLLGTLVRAKGHAIILATHVLETIGTLCNSAILLNDGAIAHHWNAFSLEEVKQTSGKFESAVMTILGEASK